MISRCISRRKLLELEKQSWKRLITLLLSTRRGARAKIAPFVYKIQKKQYLAIFSEYAIRLSS